MVFYILARKAFHPKRTHLFVIGTIYT